MGENAFQSNDDVNDEIESARRQVDYLRLDMDNKIQTIVGNTEKIDDEVKSLESKVEFYLGRGEKRTETRSR